MKLTKRAGPSEQTQTILIKLGGSIFTDENSYGTAASFLRNRLRATQKETYVAVVSAQNGTTVFHLDVAVPISQLCSLPKVSARPAASSLKTSPAISRPTQTATRLPATSPLSTTTAPSKWPMPAATSSSAERSGSQVKRISHLSFAA